MGISIRQLFYSLLFTVMALPWAVSASTEFKGKETVNINRADAPTFAAYLKGIGKERAEAIVSYRKKNGKFKSIDDLKNVPGIGDAIVGDNKRKMSTSKGVSKAPQGYKMSAASSSGKKKKSSAKKSTSKSSSKSTASSSKSSKTKEKSTSASSKKKSSSSKKSKAKNDSKSKSSSKKSSSSKAKSSKSKKSSSKKKSSKKDKKK